MKAGFVLTVQPLLFGGYVHGPQCPRSHAVLCGHLRHPGLLFMGGKRSKPLAPVGGVPKVNENIKTPGRLVRKAVGENKAKTAKGKNKPNGKKS